MDLDPNAAKDFALHVSIGVVATTAIALDVYIGYDTAFQTWHLFGWPLTLALLVFIAWINTAPITRRGRVWLEAENKAGRRQRARLQSFYDGSYEAHIDPDGEDPRRWFMSGDDGVYGIPVDLYIIGPDCVIWTDDNGQCWKIPCLVKRRWIGAPEWYPTGPRQPHEQSAA